MGSSPKKPRVPIKNDSCSKKIENESSLAIDLINFINETPGDIYKDFEFSTRIGQGSIFILK